MTFQNIADRDLHSKSDNPCEPRPTKVEGCSPEQEQQLRSRKKVTAGKSQIEKWEEMYSILFPQETKIPTACKLSTYVRYSSI